MSQKSIFGISFEAETPESVLEKVNAAWTKNEKLRIATVNPEFLVEAHANKSFRENVVKADVRVVDGFGLWLALKLSGLAIKRITGVNLVPKLLSLAEENQKKVIIILAQSGLSTSQRVEQFLQKEYSSLSSEIVMLSKGASYPNAPAADLFLVALGAPEQEYVAEGIQSGIAIGVGGSFDFLTGAQQRAPKIMQQLGMEWLYRLYQQPGRFRRIIRAVIIFPLIFISERMLTLCKIRLVQ